MNLRFFVSAAVLYLSFTSFVAFSQVREADVLVYLENEKVPENAKKLGNVKIGDNFRFVCGYDQTLQMVKEKAIKQGANIVKLTQVKAPDLMSTCYRIKAIAYHYDDITSLRKGKSTIEDSLMKTLIAPDAKYALLYIYRMPGSLAPIVSYNLHVGDSVYRMKYNTAYVTKIHKEGDLDVWARTEARDEETLNIQFGKAYFINCNVKMGVAVGQPSLNARGILPGLAEFNKTRLVEDEGSINDETKEDSVYK